MLFSDILKNLSNHWYLDGSLVMGTMDLAQTNKEKYIYFFGIFILPLQSGHVGLFHFLKHVAWCGF